MKRFLIATCLCSVLAAPVYRPAQAAESKPLEIMRPGDAALSCSGIREEISTMDGIISDTTQTQESGQITSTGVSVAKTVGGILVGTLTGAIGIMAAGHLVAEASDNDAEQAAVLQESARQRRSVMMGVFTAKGCEGPLPDTNEKIAAIEPAAGDEMIVHAPRTPRYNQ